MESCAGLVSPLCDGTRTSGPTASRPQIHNLPHIFGEIALMAWADFT
jgi:hypothetical protein